jgi:hypothetical protein
METKTGITAAKLCAMDVERYCPKPGYCDHTSSSCNLQPEGEDEHSICSHQNPKQFINFQKQLIGM